MKRSMAVLFCAFLFVSCGGNKTSGGDKQKGDGGGDKQNATIAVTNGSIRNFLEENGEIIPRTIVKVKFNFSGKIDWIYKEEGDKVAAGEKLAKVYPDINQIQMITSAQIAYQKAVAALSKLSNEVAEVTELYQQGMASKSKYDDAVNNYQIGKSELIKARLELESIEGSDSVQSKKGVSVIAPIKGTIISRLVDIGDYVIASSSYQTGTVLFEIADISDVLVEAKINEIDILNIHDGAQVDFSIDALADQSFTGKVFRVFPNPVTENNVKKYKVQIELSKNLPGTIKPGMSVKIKVLTVAKDNVPIIPISSVIRDADKKKDYVLVPSSKVEGKYEISYVTTGAWDLNFIEIKSGLKLGDKIIKKPFEVQESQIITADENSTNKTKGKGGPGGPGGPGGMH
ncbi:MAG: efflux RND transporter periplasmic adaptor subunit [Brevinematales bacterium]|nr:efflux RND transporter periplasmic adaptor subunit [Brevinematales bacterium]